MSHLRTAPRTADFGSLHETLLISGVATILVIRTQLSVTHYPQLGGHGLHIAHLLWGGLSMLAAIGLLLTFLGSAVRRTAAIVGGVGFGFFIDELGKFITEDNDYFFPRSCGACAPSATGTSAWPGGWQWSLLTPRG